MRYARKLCVAAVLALALSSSTFAGVLISDLTPVPPPPPPDTVTQEPTTNGVDTTTDAAAVTAAVVTDIVLYGISWSG
jgi:hypothetical protein